MLKIVGIMLSGVLVGYLFVGKNWQVIFALCLPFTIFGNVKNGCLCL